MPSPIACTTTPPKTLAMLGHVCCLLKTQGNTRSCNINVTFRDMRAMVSVRMRTNTEGHPMQATSTALRCTALHNTSTSIKHMYFPCQWPMLQTTISHTKPECCMHFCQSFSRQGSVRTLQPGIPSQAEHQKWVNHLWFHHPRAKRNIKHRTGTSKPSCNMCN